MQAIVAKFRTNFILLDIKPPTGARRVHPEKYFGAIADSVAEDAICRNNWACVLFIGKFTLAMKHIFGWTDSLVSKITVFGPTNSYK